VPWTCRIRANRFTFASKTCRPEAALFMSRLKVHFFKTVRSAWEWESEKIAVYVSIKGTL
jgi:hypothetical protein